MKEIFILISLFFSMPAYSNDEIKNAGGSIDKYFECYRLVSALAPTVSINNSCIIGRSQHGPNFLVFSSRRNRQDGFYVYTRDSVHFYPKKSLKQMSPNEYVFETDLGYEHAFFSITPKITGGKTNCFTYQQYPSEEGRSNINLLTPNDVVDKDSKIFLKQEILKNILAMPKEFNKQYSREVDNVIHKRRDQIGWDKPKFNEYKKALESCKIENDKELTQHAKTTLMKIESDYSTRQKGLDDVLIKSAREDDYNRKYYSEKYKKEEEIKKSKSLR